MTQHQHINEAIEQAAQAGDGALGNSMIGERATSSKRRITGARDVIRRFLENMPDDMTVAEILEDF